MKHFKIFLIILIISIFPIFSILGQDITTAEPFKMSGQLSAFGEKYSFAGTGKANRKPTTGRLQLNLNFSFFDLINVPLTGILATDQVAFRQNINQLAIHPKYKWITLHAGTFSPQFSDLTLGDASTVGGGIDLTPGLFHFSFVGGKINKGIGYNTDNVPMSYARDLYGLQFGYGEMDKDFIEVNIVKSSDIPSALPDTLTLTPQDNLATSIRFQLKFFENHLTFANEISRSSHTKNMNAKDASSTNDWGMINKIQYAQDFWSTDLKLTYIRPGYTSFGFSQLQSDRFEYLLGGKIRLLENKLMFNSNIGHRTNNLADDQAKTTKRFVFNFNSSWQVASFFGFDFLYGTNNIDIKGSNDTTSVSNVNNMIAVVPRFTFSTGEVQHVIITNVSFNNSDNSTKGNLKLLNAKTLSTLFNYTLSFASPLSFNLSTVYTKTTVDTISTEIINVTPTVNYSFADGKLSTSFGLQLGFVSPSDQKSDTEIFPQLQLNYNIAPRNTLAFGLTHRSYTYGGTTPSGDFRETIATLRYTVSF